MLRQVLATARLTRLITEDTITEDLRHKVGGLHPMVGELVGCRWCAGVWAAGIVMAADKVFPPVVDMLAVAQSGVMVMALTERMER